MPEPSPESPGFSKSQKRLIEDLAHDIRTPLAIIRSETEVLLMDRSLSSTVRHSLESTLIELERVTETIRQALSGSPR